ncbi:hypothetical protein [Leptolyngbya sp. BC1307]|uniref:hypothetical protein n=1 Tax=Leptolyngbya sp. BC1307 TaxID=2029589 RepID=UPI00148290B3|nr:hypothetical protein [Leptolyngbya sp. BC1307]
MVFKDSPAGVEAGKRAGMSVVAVPAAHMNRQLYEQADEILEQLADFDPKRWCL